MLLIVFWALSSCSLASAAFPDAISSESLSQLALDLQQDGYNGEQASSIGQPSQTSNEGEVSHLDIEPTAPTGPASSPDMPPAFPPPLNQDGMPPDDGSGVQLLQTPLTAVQAMPQRDQHPMNEPAYPGVRLNMLSKHQAKFQDGGTDITATRPGAGGGADVVSFGLFAKGFYGAELKSNKFTVDVVLFLKWTDPRVASVVPSGLDSIEMSSKAALKKIWMPEVVVTNRDIRKYELISSTVSISRSGEVFKIERSVVTCLNRYELTEYPFDQQVLHVKVASSKYLLSEVVLEESEDATASGIKDDLFKSFPYEMEKWEVRSFKETDGALKKSRGSLDITIERLLDKYAESHLMPTGLLLMISWSVFWFPFENPFITPRLALSILALLSFTNLVIKSNTELPPGAPNNWNDVLNLQVQALMFCTIVLNILSEVCKHQLKLEDLAIQVNNENKVLLPCLSLTVVGIILTAGKWKWLSVLGASILTKVVIITVIGVYLGFITSSLSAARKHKAEVAAQEKKNAPPDPDLERLRSIRSGSPRMPQTGAPEQTPGP